MRTNLLTRVGVCVVLCGIACLGAVVRGEQAAETVKAGRTKSALEALTPDRVIEKLKAGNERFVGSQLKDRNHIHDISITSKGQYPIAAVVGCMDSRVPAAIVFDQGIGDIFALAIAGNVVNHDIVGSLEYACKVTGSKVIVVLGHTECGAVKGAIDHVDLGNLTGLLDKIEPAMDDVPDTIQPRTTSNKAFVNAVAQANVYRMVREIRDRSSILDDLEKQGAIKIVGAMYDVGTGRVTFLP